MEDEKTKTIKPRTRRIKDDTFNISTQQEDDLTLLEWLSRTCQKMFVDNLPLDSIRELENVYMYIFGFLAYAAGICLFCFFFSQCYSDSRDNAFVSLQIDAGDCIRVLHPVTGHWLISQDGFYEGDSLFQYSLAIYSLKLANFEASEDNYGEIMLSLREELLLMGQLATSNNLADNMIVWSSWQTNYIVNGQKNIFGMNREPASIFDNHYLTGFISTVHGDCRVNSTEKYDFTRGMMTLNYNYNAFGADHICSEVNATKFGYNRFYDRNLFAINLDVSSAMTCIAVNSNILKITALEKVYITDFHASSIQATVMKALGPSAANISVSTTTSTHTQLS